MNMQKLPSDIIGLSKVMPPLSRRGFMSSSAAAAAGYTLAAGPVRADAIQTDTNGLKAGMADVAVTGGNMPVYFARPANVQNPPVILVCMEIFGLHEWVKDITRRVGHLGALADRAELLFPFRNRRRRPDQDRRHEKHLPDRQRQDRYRTVRRSRRHRGLGEVAGRRHQPARHHGLLPRRP